VVAIEGKDESIAVQYANGDLGEYDNDGWYNSTFDYIEDPEDWSAPFGEIEDDDLGYSDTDRHKRADQEDLDISDFLDWVLFYENEPTAISGLGVKKHHFTGNVWRRQNHLVEQTA